jgi:hypothetical protein
MTDQNADQVLLNRGLGLPQAQIDVDVIVRKQISRAELQAIAALGRDDEEAQQRLEVSLIDFVEAAWPSLDAAEYKSCWAFDALCEHLQAVTDGQIKKLLVNFPPRCAKTLVTSVCWPAWTWSRR